MCAIAGCLHFKNKGGFSIQSLLEIMTHRGPDQTAFIDQELWSLGMNRLAIVSADEKHTQPLWSPDKRFCFVFNGEIYNYKEIKKDLENQNYLFKSSCDSEVLFYAYLAYGTEAFIKCQGMFVCAIFDTLKKKMILARDPLGIKPLYFYTDREQFAFASEIKALLLLKKPEIHFKALPYYLQKRFVPGKETLFKGIFRLPPGELMTISSKKEIKSVKYWTPSSSPKAGEDCNFSYHLNRSVQLCSKSEIPYAILLSGGVDSSLINSLICSEHHSSLPPAYFFDNTYDKQEKDSVQSLIQKTGQKLQLIESSKEDFLLLPKIIMALEEPLGDSIIIPTYKLLQKVSQKHKVVLSGEGADELLAGYTHHWLFYALKKFSFATKSSHLLSIEKFLPEAFLNLLFPYPGQFKKNRLKQLLKQIQNQGLKRYLEMISLFDTQEINSLFPDLLMDARFRGHDGSDGHDRIGEHDGVGYPDIYQLKDLIHYDLQNWLANYNLLRIDKLSMSHSLEVRVPYLNLDFVHTCLNLPEQDILSLWTRKKILRKVAKKQALLDHKIAYRKKHPFTLDITKAYNKKYYDFVRDHLDDSFRKTYNIPAKILDQWLDKNSQYLGTQKQITSLLNLALWTKNFFK